MVEGHSVHRVASRHRSKLVGKKFADWLKKQVTDRNHAIAVKRDMMA